MKVMLLFVLFSLVVLNHVEAEENSDEDPDLLFWKTVYDGPGPVSVYENVDLKENSFLAVCLGYQFNREIPVDGQIYLETYSRNKVFEWKSHFNSDDTKSYSRLQCFGGDSICYSTEQSKCNEDEKIESLPFGHCKEDMSMMISSESFTISCGDQVVDAKRCSDGVDTGPANFNITVKDLKNGVCATRIRPNNSGWIDVLSGESTNRSIDFKSHSLFINQLMIREKNLDTTLFTVNFHAVVSEVPDDSAVMVITLESSGTYMYKTYVTLTATVCNASTVSKKYFVGQELGKTQIQITLVGDQIAIIFSDGSGGEVVQQDTIWLPSCSKVGESEMMMMSFEDATAKRNTYLMGNTNIKIVEKGECLEPDIKSYGLKIFGEDQPEQLFQIGSEVRLECENPMYEIEGNNKITCQLNKTWTPDEFPVCVRKTCEESKYLDSDGTCKDCFEFAERCEIQEEMADDSVLKMDAEDCRDEATFKSLNGTYEVYKMIMQTEGANWYEGENVTYACSVSYNTPYACFDLLEATVKDLSLVVNGVVQTEGVNLTTSSGVNDGDLYIYFHLILHYESHHQSDLMCSYQLSDTATLVSQVTKIMRVDELFEVVVTPPSTTIKMGESFTLTCHTETHRALPHIRWSRQLGDGDDEDIDCGEITANEEFTCLNSTNTPGSMLIVKTIDTEKFVEEQYSYFCQAKSVVHSNQPQAEARVTVLGLTSGAVIGNTFWSIFVVLVLI